MVYLGTSQYFPEAQPLVAWTPTINFTNYTTIVLVGPNNGSQVPQTIDSSAPAIHFLDPRHWIAEPRHFISCTPTIPSSDPMDPFHAPH